MARILPVQSGSEPSVLQRAEALDNAAIAAILEVGFAAIGCTLPGDLVTAFEVFLVDRTMMSLGQAVGPEVAQQGVVALRLRSTTIHHPEASAVLAVARALDGQVAHVIESGRLALRRGVYLVEDCVPEGTLFALSPYAER